MSTPSSSSPAPPSSPMPPCRRSSLGDGAHHRAPSFSVRDFEQLVSNAFNLPSPTLLVTPASPPTPGPRSAISPSAKTMGESYFDDFTDDEHARRRETLQGRPSHRPRSHSFSAFNLQHILPLPSSTHGESSSRPGLTKRVLKTLRTRASALVLRPSHMPRSPIDGRDTPASMLTLSSRTSTSTARPPSQYSPVPQSPRFVFPSRNENSSPSSLRGPPPDVELDVKVSVTRHRSKSLPLNILKIPQHPARDGPRSAHTPLPKIPRSKSPAPTLLGDLISTRRSTTSSFSSAHPWTPSQPSASTSPLRIHTHLPPLNKSRSFNLLSGHDRKYSRASSMAGPILPSLAGASSMAIEFEEGELPAWCPEPYTNPRPPPTPPTPTSPYATSHDLWRDEDTERPLGVPSYVFERRGSSTSISSTATGKSTQTLADRISQAIPRSLKMTKLRSRSKLNLSVITSSSNESTQSSFDTFTTFSSSGAGSMPPTPHSNSFHGVASSRRTSVDSQTDAMAVDRVLTLEQDPFAKGNIEIPRSRTPMPFDVPDPPAMPKKSFPGKKAWERTLRRKWSASGHSHTNSGDTITPLTSSWDTPPSSPMDVDGPEMEPRPFVFPTPEMTASSLSPPPTPYSEWSPIGLRQGTALPHTGDYSAHIVPLPSSPTPSRRSFSLPIPPSPGPPPSIPLPSSPTLMRTEFVPPSPSSPHLRKRKSQSSLRAAALLNADRPPSPFPMATSAVSSVSSLFGPVVPSPGTEQLFVSGLHCTEGDTADGMSSRGNRGWVRGPRFALGSLGAAPTRPMRPVPPQGFGPPRGFAEPDADWHRTVSGRARLPALSPQFSALGFSLDNKPYPSFPVHQGPNPRVRPSHSDSALRTRSRADARPKHPRATSQLERPRATLTEIEERWEGDTSRSTAFYSARSSMLSNISSVVGAGQEFPHAI